MLTVETTDDKSSNFTIKIAVLLLLCCQNAGLALLCRYSKGVLKENYSSTEVVCVAETLKILISGYLSVTDSSETDAVGKGFSKLIWLTLNAKKIIILVILYSFANLLTFYALARIDASVYTVLTQLKTFTTAGFAVLILGRNISATKWRALSLLVLGCILVASPTFNTHPLKTESIATLQPISLLQNNLNFNSEIHSPHESETVVSAAHTPTRYLLDTTPFHTIGFDALLGIGAVILMDLLSGYSAVYFEGMLRRSSERITIWERNFQLALYSALFLLLSSFYTIYMKSLNVPSVSTLIESEEGNYLFKGWTINTFMISCTQAAGGLLVAATLKYADAVLKTLATSGSIVLSALIGYWYLDGDLDMFVVIGCLATILAISNYTLDNEGVSPIKVKQANV